MTNISELTKFQTVLTRRLDSALGGLGLNEFVVLYELTQAKCSLRRIDLAEKIGLTASGITRMLLPMEKIGLIKREANENDARSSLVVITTSGTRMFEEGLDRMEIFCDDNFLKNDQNKFLEIIGSIEFFTNVIRIK